MKWRVEECKTSQEWCEERTEDVLDDNRLLDEREKIVERKEAELQQQIAAFDSRVAEFNSRLAKAEKERDMAVEKARQAVEIPEEQKRELYALRRKLKGDVGVVKLCSQCRCEIE